MIVQVNQAGGKKTVFLALPVSNLSSSAPGPIMLNGSGKAAIRGYSCPGGVVAEFVYPKGEAVTLAKANDTKIPAIDPASEGMPEDPKLSRTDLQMVTLWMLSPQPVGPDSPGLGIKAARYEAPQGAAPHASPKPKPAVVASLPHTASELPLIWVLGLACLGGAAGLSLGRKEA